VITEAAVGVDLTNTIRPTRLLHAVPGAMIGRLENGLSLKSLS